MYFWLTNYSSCQTSKDAHAYFLRLRMCLLEELQPSSGVSNVTENGLTYDEHLHSSMQTAVSICMQTQNDSSNDPAPPKSKWCDWAMDSFSFSGLDTPHQERCIGHEMKMVTCHHIGCSTKVHRLCRIDWLTRHRYEPPPQHFCWQHSNCCQLWRRFRANKIQRSENGFIPGSELAAG